MTSGTMPFASSGAHHADMGKATRGAAAEREPDARSRRLRRLRLLHPPRRSEFRSRENKPSNTKHSPRPGMIRP